MTATRKTKKNLRKRIPQVAILLESSHEISRGMIRGILAYVRVHGPWALHLESGGARDLQMPDMKVWRGNGIIARLPTPQVAADVVSARLPAVLIDPLDAYLCPKHPLSRCSRIQCDSAEVGRLAAEHFLANDFEHFAFVGEPTGMNWSRWRREAFVRRLQEADRGCAVYQPPDAAECDEWEVECRRMSRWLKRLPKPLAVFAANDARGRQVLNACLAADLPVPYEVAVLGVNNDIMICETSQPPLSSVAVDMEQAGYAAAELLDKLMRKILRGQQRAIFKPQEVVTRASTQRLQVNDRLVIRALEHIRINAGLNVRVSDVADHVGVTPRWLEKRFAQTLGRSAMEEIQRARMATVSSLVADTGLAFTEIARRCGFTGANHLGVLFRAALGMTMSEYRQRRRTASMGPRQ